MLCRNLSLHPSFQANDATHIRSIYNMSPKSAWNNPVNVIDKLTLFVQLDNLDLHVSFGAVENLPEPVLIET